MTDQNNQNETPNPNSVTLIGMFSDGIRSPIMMMRSGEGALHPPMPGLTGPMGLRRIHGTLPDPNYHRDEAKNDEAKNDYDDLPEMLDVNGNITVGQGVNDKSMMHGVGSSVDEVEEGKMPLPKKKEIQVTSDVTSTMDKDGNMEIKVTYDFHSYQCCVCYDGIIGPIVSCDNAHSLCSDCIVGIAKTGDHRCPVCRSNAKGRNYLLENALLGMINICPFAKQGCRHKSYPANMEEHMAICRYAEIDCPWCEEKTTPFDLQTHTEFKCKKKFSGMSCSNHIDFIKSDKINNVFLVSAMEGSRILYVEKTETDCNLLCIQGTNPEDQINSIVMTYSIDVKSLDDMKLTETRKIMLPIHKPEHLIKGRVLMHTIPLKELAKKKNIVITGFSEKYRKGGRWMAMDNQGNWYRATIIEREYNPDAVLVKFDGYIADKHDEWIDLDDELTMLRPLDANEGRTTREERQYVENLDEDEQLRLVMERSMNET
jgi:hypothetical protein